MFVAQAHSFRQQARLAITLAWVAGYTNVVGLIECGVAVSHVSGTASGVGRDAANAEWRLAGIAGWLLAWFLVGALLSGLSMDRARRRGRKSIYVMPIAIEALALTAFAILVAKYSVLSPETLAGGPLLASTATACFAMGLQNATITRISGGVVRTTHVTGVLTDLGLELSHLLVPHEPQRQRSTEAPAGGSHRLRALLLASILGSFVFGAALAGLVTPRAHGWGMIPPVAFLLWIIWQDMRRPIADLEPEALESVSPGIVVPDNLAYFRLRCRGSRAGGLHRLPNMQVWADQLDPDVDVVVLDLSDADEVDLEGAQDLRAVAQRLHHSHRALAIAGVDSRRFESLRTAGVTEVMPVGSVAADPELALAYAIERAAHFARRARSRDYVPRGG